MAAPLYPFMPAHRPETPAAILPGSSSCLRARDLVGGGLALATALGPAPAVLCLCDNRLHVAMSLLAALVMDSVCVMPHDRSPATLRRLRRLYPGARAIAESERAEALGAEAVEPMIRGAAGPGIQPESLAWPGTRRAAHVFTSGSTGEPRLHEKNWGSLAAAGRDLARRFAVRPGSAVVATVPGQHVYGLEASIMLPLAAGGVLHPGAALLPGDVADSLAAVPAPRLLVSTPLQLKGLVDAGVAVPAVDAVVSATAPLDAALAARIEQHLGAPVHEMYGSTETGVVATRRTVAGDIWEPMPEVRVASERGYCKVASAHLDRPITLEDLIEMCPDGGFRLTGRSGDIVKIAGKRSSLGDVTARLLAVPGVRDAAVFAPPAGPGNVQRLVAFVVAPEVPPGRIRSALRDQLDPAFLPRPIVPVPRIPRGFSGKVSRQTLERMHREHAAAGGESHQVETEANLVFAEDHPALPGHFPGRPLVPAVVILEAVLAEAPEGICGVRSAKFMQPVKPGVALRLRGRATAGGGWRFSLQDDAGTVLVRGELARLP